VTRHRLPLAVLSLSTVILGMAPAQDQTQIARIEAAQSPNRQGWDPYALPQLMERFGVPGASVAVIKDYQVHWAKGYGQADVTTKAPVGPDTMFQAASISKPVTAFAVMRLVERGQLSLDEDVNRYLKSCSASCSSMTRPRTMAGAGARWRRVAIARKSRRTTAAREVGQVVDRPLCRRVMTCRQIRCTIRVDRQGEP
jgi:CubicO group peptidase (beta-lactamase class C family)